MIITFIGLELLKKKKATLYKGLAMIDADKKLIEELKRSSLFYSDLEWKAAVRLRELIDSGNSYYKRAIELQEENYYLRQAIKTALDKLEEENYGDAFYTLYCIQKELS